MMTDIVERLRNLDTATCEDAADEIERLRGGMLKMASTMSTQVETIERLRAALREIESLDDAPQCCGRGIHGYDSPPECCGDPERGIDRAQSIARAALEVR